jgi:hypothetical protein
MEIALAEMPAADRSGLNLVALMVGGVHVGERAAWAPIVANRR